MAEAGSVRPWWSTLGHGATRCRPSRVLPLTGRRRSAPCDPVRYAPPDLCPSAEFGDAAPRVMSVVTVAKLFNESVCPVLWWGGASARTHTGKFFLL